VALLPLGVPRRPSSTSSAASRPDRAHPAGWESSRRWSRARSWTTKSCSARWGSLWRRVRLRRVLPRRDGRRGDRDLPGGPLTAEAEGVARHRARRQGQRPEGKRLKVVDAFRTSGNNRRMIMDAPVSPPDRPMVQLDGGRRHERPERSVPARDREQPPASSARPGRPT